jgi:hypothetical protein
MGRKDERNSGTGKGEDSWAQENDFGYWCAGIIDGDGCILLSKKGYPSAEITVGEDEVDILYKIKKYVGGSINHRKSTKSYRWRLHNRSGIANLLRYILYRTLNPTVTERCGQVAKLLYATISNDNEKKKLIEIQIKKTESGILENAWLSGFFDAEGYFAINSSTYQASITLSQKTKPLLEYIAESLGGIIHFDRSPNGYLYEASSKEDCDRWFGYLQKYPLRSKKKSSRYIQFCRYRLFLQRGYHLSGNVRKKTRFINLHKALCRKKI